MTAPRRPRSAWLLVGSTPSVWVKLQSAGQRFRRFFANCRWYLVLGLLRAACSRSARSLSWSGAVVAELFLVGHAFAVGGEVSDQVGPAELSLARVEVVVAAPAVGADDPGEALAEQHPRLGRVAAGRDPEDRGSAGQRAPQCPPAAGGLPPGLVDIDDRGRLDPLLELRMRRGERLADALHDRVD